MLWCPSRVEVAGHEQGETQDGAPESVHMGVRVAQSVCWLGQVSHHDAYGAMPSA